MSIFETLIKGFLLAKRNVVVGFWGFLATRYTTPPTLLFDYLVDLSRKNLVFRGVRFFQDFFGEPVRA